MSEVKGKAKQKQEVDMKKLLSFLSLTALIVSALLLPITASAAETATVTVTATGSYISVTNTPNTEALGGVIASSTVWAHGSTPADPLEDGECTFTFTNEAASSVNVNVTIKMADMTGGVGWTNADAETAGADIFYMMAGASGVAHSAMVLAKESSAYNTLISNLAPSATKKWEFAFHAPTSFGDGVQKSGDITLTATSV